MSGRPWINLKALGKCSSIVFKIVLTDIHLSVKKEVAGIVIQTAFTDLHFLIDSSILKFVQS